MPEHPTTRALLSIIPHASEPMCLSDPNQPDHPIIATNHAFERITGYPAAETIGRNCRFLQGPATDPETPARIRSAIEARQGCIEWMVNYRRDGSKFWNLLFMVPVFASDGTLLHYFANQRDFGAEVPEGLPADYVLGRATLPPDGQAAFNAILTEAIAARGPGAASVLEHGILAAHALNHVTTRLHHENPNL